MTIPENFVIKSAKFKTDKSGEVTELILTGEIKGKLETIILPRDKLYIDKEYEEKKTMDIKSSEEFRKSPEFIQYEEFKKLGVDLHEQARINAKKKLEGISKLTIEEREKSEKYENAIPIATPIVDEKMKTGKTATEIAIMKFNKNRAVLKEYFKYTDEEQEKILSSIWANGDCTSLLIGNPGSGKSFYIIVSSLLFCNGLTRDEIIRARGQWYLINKQIDDLTILSEEKHDPAAELDLKCKKGIRTALFREIKEKMRRHYGLIKMDETKEPGETFYELGISLEPTTPPIPYVHPAKIEYKFEPLPRSVVLKPIKFFNEINRGNPSTLNALLGLLAEKEIEYLGKTFRSPNNVEDYVRKKPEDSYLWTDITTERIVKEEINVLKPDQIPFDADMDVITKTQKKVSKDRYSWLSSNYLPYTIAWGDSNPHVAKTMDRALLDRIDICLYFPTITMSSKEDILLKRYELQSIERTEDIIVERIITPYIEDRIEPLFYEDIERIWRENKSISIKEVLPIISLSTEIFSVAGSYYDPSAVETVKSEDKSKSPEGEIYTEADKLIDWSRKDFEMKIGERKAIEYPTNYLSCVLGLRISESLTKLAKSLAMINLRKEVTEDEVRILLPYVVAHRYGFGTEIAIEEFNYIVDYYPNLQEWIKERIVNHYLYDLDEKTGYKKQKLKEWLGYYAKLESALGIKEKTHWSKEPNFAFLELMHGSREYREIPMFQRIYDDVIEKLKKATAEDVKKLFTEISILKKMNYSSTQIENMREKIRKSIIVNESISPKTSDMRALLMELNLLEEILKYSEQISDPAGMKYFSEFLKKKKIAFDDSFSVEQTITVKDGNITIFPNFERKKSLLYLSFNLDITKRDSALEFVYIIKLCKEASIPENKIQIEKILG